MVDTKKSFKQLEVELDAILARVETATYEELDDLLKDYDNGMQVIDELQKKLQIAKNTIIKAGKSKS